MEKLQAVVDDADEWETARHDAMVAELQEARTTRRTRVKRTYLPLGTRVRVNFKVVPVYHKQDYHLYRLLDRQELPDTTTGLVVGVRFLAEGLHHKFSAGLDEDESEPAYLETYRTVPVYLVARTLFVKPIQVRLDDVMEMKTDGTAF